MSSLFAADWSHWRGPTQNGIVTSELPTRWSETEGILWKTELPPWGSSTPIIVGDSIFLTTHENDDKLVLIRLNKADGKIVWSREIASGIQTPRLDYRGFRGWVKFNEHHNLASPSVAADPETIIALFGTGDLTGFDWTGNLLWKVNLQDEFGNFMHWHGYAGSPLLYENLVIIPVMQDDLRNFPERTGDLVESYIVAYDKTTGKQAWKVSRTTGASDEHNDAYTTPILWKHEGRVEMLILGSETLDAYNPKTGERYWWLDKGLEGYRVVPCPLPCESLGMVFVTRARQIAICGITPRGLGEQPESALTWMHTRGTPEASSAVLVNGLLFYTNDQGIATCFDPKTGEVHWERRLPAGTYFRSLLTDGKHVYYMNNDGLCTIVKAGKEFEEVAQNKIEGVFFASPIGLDGKLYVRCREAIYCIGK